MKTVRYVLIFVSVFILQSTLLRLIALGEIEPDLIIVALFYVALLEGSYGATIAGFCVGLLQDIYHPHTLGLNALCKSLVGFGLGYCQRGVFMEGLIPRSFILFAAVMVHDIIYFLLSYWPEVGKGFSQVFRVGIPAALYTAILGYVVFYLIRCKEQLQPLQEPSQ
jgi:rod shape-determining protein MreD